MPSFLVFLQLSLLLLFPHCCSSICSFRFSKESAKDSVPAAVVVVVVPFLAVAVAVAVAVVVVRLLLSLSLLFVSSTILSVRLSNKESAKESPLGGGGGR